MRGLRANARRFRSAWSRAGRLLLVSCALAAFLAILLSNGAWATSGGLLVAPFGMNSTIDLKTYDPAVGEEQEISVYTTIDVTGCVDDKSYMNWTVGDHTNWTVGDASVSFARVLLLDENGLSYTTSHQVSIGTVPVPSTRGCLWIRANLYLMVSRPAVLDFQYLLINPVISDTTHCYLTAGFFWNTDPDFSGGTQVIGVSPDNWTTGSTVNRSLSMVPGRYYRVLLESEGGFGYKDGAAPGNHSVNYFLGVREGTPPTVEAGPGGSVSEGSAFTGSGSFTDPDPDTWTGTADYGDGSGAQSLTLKADKTFSLSHVYGHEGTYHVTVTVNEDGGYSGSDTCTVTVSNANPVLGNVTGLPSWVPVGATVNPSAAFSDPGSLDTHTAVWNWGDGSSSACSVSETGGAGTATASHVYRAAGHYTATLTVTDDGGASAAAAYPIDVGTAADLINILYNRIDQGDLSGQFPWFMAKVTILTQLRMAQGMLLYAHLPSYAAKTIAGLVAFVNKQKGSGISNDGAAQLLAALNNISAAINAH